ncbi:serine/threonine-protein kinase [Polyangium sp. 15x6]|uniref:serine/threonine-protein kinase n=1 Tax=Polyangium sp. 15x6 TaxID=3042687 RepID=UPI00249B01D5|nr:serine/threonine-protein kinase [Polyangium sp. 15x6]MDI3287352.1 serine/threonine-protein kinase [Polyangium sp. 15x6]
MLEEVLGEGVDARVFAALDLGAAPPRRVAIKLALEARVETRLRLAREARWLNHMQNCTGVARPIEPEIKEHEDIHFLVREFVPGPTLRQVLEHRRVLRVDEAVRIGIALARTLSSIHEAGIVLRDLKPENIVLRDGHEPIVIDLDLVTPIEGGEVDDPDIMTPAYAAPEQRAGEPAAPASDIYALGLILAEMAGGCAPVAGEVEPRGLARCLARVVRDCLARDPRARPRPHEVARVLDIARTDTARRRRRGVGVTMLGFAMVAAILAPFWTHLSPRRPVALAETDFLPGFLARGGAYVYWTNGGGVVARVKREGGTPEVIARGPALCARAVAFAASGQLYWNDTDGQLWAWFGGVPVEVLQRPSKLAGGIAVGEDGAVFYTGWQSGEILRVDPRGKNSLQVLAAGQNRPYDVAIDEAHVYWTNQGGTVARMRREGGTPEELASGQPWPQGIALDQTHVYWVNQSGGSVMRVAKAGGEEQVLAMSAVGLEGIAVDDMHVYWTSPEEGRVLRIPKQGGGAEVIADGQDNPYDVLVDEEAVYWTNRGERGQVIKWYK